MAQDMFLPVRDLAATSLPRGGRVMWPALSFGSEPLQQGRALGPLAVVQVQKAKPWELELLVSVAVCAA